MPFVVYRNNQMPLLCTRESKLAISIAKYLTAKTGIPHKSVMLSFEGASRAVNFKSIPYFFLLLKDDGTWEETACRKCLYLRKKSHHTLRALTPRNIRHMRTKQAAFEIKCDTCGAFYK